MDISSIINAMHSPESNPQRNGFDLSHRKVLTYKAGELLPILVKECVPKDYIEVDLAALVRSVSPLNTAAFMRSKIYFDFFFVPMTSVWRNFDKFYYQRDDNYSSYTNSAAYEPNITILDINRLLQYGSTSSPVDSQESRCKLVNLLGYGNWINEDTLDYESTGDYAAIGVKSLTALPIYAYNRIYNLHYRDAWKDAPSPNAVRDMSADDIVCSSYANSVIDKITNSNDHNFIRMHYHRYPQDLFIGLLPSQQFGSVSSVSMSSDLVFQDYSQIPASLGSAVVGRQSADNRVVFSDSNDSTKYTIGVSSSNFDVIALRRAIAAQKWKEYNARAGWKAGKQAKAMFGVNTPDDRKHDVEFIDSYAFPVMVDEVVQQSATVSSGGTTQALGELAGKVIGVGNGHKIKYNVGERHGYFFCISYILPQVEYNAVGIDKQLVRSTPESHYMPAFANLGLEAVYKFELDALSQSVAESQKFDATLGFTTRYHEYKTDVDKVYAEFQTGGSLQSWVTVRRDLQNAVASGSIPLSLLYVNPIILDTVFLAQASPSISTDQFMVNVNFDLKMVRPMSALGLPTL